MISQTFAAFCKEHGYPADQDTLDHSMLSPNGKVSGTAKAAAQDRYEERLKQNAQAHREYNAAVKAGKIEDPSGKVSTAKFSAEEQKKLQKQIEALQGRLKSLDDMQLQTYGKNGKLKPKYQKQADEWKAEQERLRGRLSESDRVDQLLSRLSESLKSGTTQRAGSGHP